ncbi:tRNA (guanine-N(7)-)-methyltransferase non-catalytic subunit wdr4 isoform X2 [Panulirus ornatus]|uniref:tRNA (guanine-N(7)-)-methyltransferase non-catalytic subunit wdr4 isoform X2 n=1 Tax=Panulirus ornatus TaxID=150431 RepID=UPI003A88E86B
MGLIEVFGDFIAFGCGKNILIYNNRNSETHMLDVSEVNEKLEINEKNTGSNDEDKLHTYKSCETQLVSVRASPDGQYLAVACEKKVVTVWSTETWKLHCSHSLVKRPVAIAITSDSGTLLVADKSGDVYHFPLKGVTSENELPHLPYQKNSREERTEKWDDTKEKPLMGHISMLLDLTVTEDIRYIITCDRDEKIRVSHYPNSYNIEAFCLGHQEFVTQVSLLSKSNQLILSCSGDGTLRLWNYLKGLCVACIDTREQTTSLLHHYEKYMQQRINESEEARRYLPDYPAVMSFSLHSSCSEDILVAALLHRIPAVLLYKIKGTEVEHISTVELEAEPQVVAWSQSGELIVQHEDNEQPLCMFKLLNGKVQQVAGHDLVSLGRKHKHLFTGQSWLNLDILYKQRYDNVADYMKKKEERLAMEKAAKDGLIPPYKKGRWSK